MANLSPQKPPRGVKYGRESGGSGLLVTVIKTLDSSESLEERQREKLKIEKEFKKMDVKLNELVAQHDGQLSTVMQLFGQVSGKISTSRQQIRGVKESLIECKKLLRCKREELQRLWSDAVQQKYVAEMLEQIHELRKVPATAQSLIAKKQYLHATRTLVDGSRLANGALAPIEGLSDLRADLQQRTQLLYVRLCDELHRHVYQHSCAETLSNFQRHGSTRNSHLDATAAVATAPKPSPFQRSGIRRSAERAAANQKMRQVLAELATQGAAFDVAAADGLVENTDLLDADASFFIIVECMAQLRRLPDAVETVRSQLAAQLRVVVQKTAAHMMAVRPTLVATELTRVQHPLLELLELVHAQFKLVAAAQQLLLKHFLGAAQRHGVGELKLFGVTEFWEQAQRVLQALLTDYLDIQNVQAAVDTDAAVAAGFVETATNVNVFFGRRKQQYKKSLFHFDKSATTSAHTASGHDASDSTGSAGGDSAATADGAEPGKDHRRIGSDASNDLQLPSGGGGVKPTTGGSASSGTLVCPPDAALLRIVYVPLIAYVHEIEALLKHTANAPCVLHQFLTAHVRDTFLAQGHCRTLERTVEGLAKNADAWRTLVPADEAKALGLQRPLLQSTVLFERRIAETKQLIHDLPDFCDDLLKMVCKLLKTYRETCQVAYRGIVQPETEDKRIYSVAWLKDDDISRFLKTLPNWTDLKSTAGQRHQRLNAHASSASTPPSAAATRKASTLKTIASEEESPTQVQQRNIREAEMLTSNLGESGIGPHEILADVAVLRELATLQESMEWFGCRISEFAGDLRVAGSGVGERNIDGTIKVLTNLALEFDDLANTCLLVLHLEVRVQCFHYLRPVAAAERGGQHQRSGSGQAAAAAAAAAASAAFSHGNDLLEPEPKVQKLTKVLSEMEEAMTAALHPRKTKYIFEGLAHLAARILINAANYMEAIDESGVQRMCRNALSLKQTLGSITSSREIALDQTVSFYEMFRKDPQEILTQIIERGATYTELQYLNALQLACKSKGISDANTIASYQQQLSDILGTKEPAVLAGGALLSVKS